MVLQIVQWKDMLQMVQMMQQMAQSEMEQENYE